MKLIELIKDGHTVKAEPGQVEELIKKGFKEVNEPVQENQQDNKSKSKPEDTENRNNPGAK